MDLGRGLLSATSMFSPRRCMAFSFAFSRSAIMRSGTSTAAVSGTATISPIKPNTSVISDWATNVIAGGKSISPRMR
ncbi:MAG: hypothetical protein CK550_04765 [Gemmatimonadetes bacterium]|nr:MAG: hypothetical protein CK550_04765 [Gemmatimonadota bacterium]